MVGTLRRELLDRILIVHQRHLRSVQARYSHITAVMRCRLLDGLTDLGNAALDQRMSYRVGSPVTVLDALLRQRRSLGEF